MTDPLQRFAATFAADTDAPDDVGIDAAQSDLPQDAMMRLAETYRQDPEEVEQSDEPVDDSADEPADQAEPDEPDEQQQIEVDPEVRRVYGEVVEDLGLNDDTAQALLERMSPVIVQRQHQQAAELREQWAAQARADRELMARLPLAKSALRQFGDAELRTLLNRSGLGNHPAVVRLLVRVGKALGRGPRQVAEREADRPRATAAASDPLARLATTYRERHDQ